MMLRCDVSLTKDWRNQNLPIPIYDFMARWKRKAEEAMKTYEFQWPAKLVETQFIYEGCVAGSVLNRRLLFFLGICRYNTAVSSAGGIYAVVSEL